MAVHRVRRAVRSMCVAAALSGCGGGGGGDGAANAARIGPGRYDPDFGQEVQNPDDPFGYSLWSLVGDGPGWKGVLVQPDGRIVVVGTQVVSATDHNFEVMRLEPNGRDPDYSFGAYGTRYVDFGGIDEAFGVVRRPSDGVILVVGRTSAVGGGAIAVAALASNGTPDLALGGLGRTVIDPTTGEDEGSAIAIQLDENVLIAGSTNLASGVADFVLYRMFPSGVLDFGPATATWGFDDRCAAIALDYVTGNIVLAGTSNAGPGGDNDFAVARFLPTGGLDPTFNGVGRQLVDIDLDDHGMAVQVDGSGRTLVSGYTLDGISYSMTAVRLGHTGAVDTSWNASPSPAYAFPHNGDGYFQHHMREQPAGIWSNDGALCSLLEPDGSLVLVGSSALPGSTSFKGAILKLDPLGHMDPTFGNLPFGGNVLESPSGTRIFAIARDSQGRLLLAGQKRSGGATSTQFGYVGRVGG